MQPLLATLVLSLILAAIACPILLWQRYVLTRRWKALADTLGLDYDPQPFNQMVAGGPALNKFARWLFQDQPQLVGTYRDRPVVIGVAFADLLHDAEIYRERLHPRIDSCDRPLRQHVTLRAAIKTQLPEHFHCICAKPGHLLAKTSGDLLTVAHRRRLPSQKSGDRRLDRHFRLHCTPATPAQILLVDPTVHQLLTDWTPRKPLTEVGARTYGIEIQHGWLLYEEHRPSQFLTERGVLETLTRIDQLADALAAAADSH